MRCEGVENAGHTMWGQADNLPQSGISREATPAVCAMSCGTRALPSGMPYPLHSPRPVSPMPTTWPAPVMLAAHSG